ncbi:hypothetical protein EBZ38_06910 [bacterium]|nr:hypothetical protein [bacterium]
MKIYKQEVLDGIAEKVQADTTVAYCSQAVVCPVNHEISQKIKASANPKQIDLYYIKSILVSTGWNKNDDVFSPEQTWAARTTPEDKQFNFMHNENDIIGHITGSYIVDRSGNTIDSNLDNTPQDFDIITEAVLYNSWTSPDNRERMQKIINEIEQGKWFVSMECLFAGFDYALIDQQGNPKVIARNEQSSFLTKHLRAYGGTGEYEGYKVGRSLRDISFSGKGLVSKPANPRSIILDSSRAFLVNKQDDVILNIPKGEIQMSDTNLEQIVNETPSELTSANTINEVVSTTVEEVTPNYAETISALEASLTEKTEAFKALEETLKANETVIKELQDALAAKDAEMMDMKKKEKNRTRKDKLMASGFEESEADESLSLYENLDDNAFEAIVAMYKKKMAKMDKKSEFKEDITEDEKNESTNPKAAVVASEVEKTEEVTETLFDGVNSTEAALVDASDINDELQATRASVAQWLTENVLRK